MSKEILGHLDCPHCDNTQATVHQAAGRNRALYYRCYDGDDGDCGTVQISGVTGQRFIRGNMRPLNAIEIKQAAEVAGSEAATSQIKSAKKLASAEDTNKPKGFFTEFFEDEK